MMKKLVAMLLAILMCLSIGAVFAEETESEVIIQDITYELDFDEIKNFSSVDFGDICLSQFGEQLSYITIDEYESTYGTLRYDYDGKNDKISGGATKYYRASSSSSSKLISDITYLPKTNFDGETMEAVFTYKAYLAKEAEDGTKSYEGKIVITVNKVEEVEGAALDKIIMYVDAGDKIKLDVAEFQSICRNSGFRLEYMMFPALSNEVGKLYYNYKSSSSKNTEVSASKKYLAEKVNSSSLLIENITLVLSKDLSGDFNFTYLAYDEDDVEHMGIISFKVESDNELDENTYEAKGEYVELVARRFREECRENLGAELDYVKFSKASSGTLYYDYNNEEGSKATVSTTKKYYYGKEPYLYLVSYVPKANYKGTATVDYVSYSVDGDSYSGTISINVDTKGIEEVEDVKYTVKNTSYKTFSATTFQNLCEDATGEELDYIKFSAPSSGKLYYKYTSSKDKYTISASDRFYVSEADYIKYVSYVPKAGYSGTATVKYTGYTEEETMFMGEIKFNVTGTSQDSDSDSDKSTGDVSDLKLKGEVGKAIKLDGDDFSDLCEDEFDVELDYIKFTVPSASTAEIIYKYGETEEKKILSSYMCYYEDNDPLISEISIIPRKAETITIKYKGESIWEDAFEGSIKITVEGKGHSLSNFKLSKSYKSGQFKDVDEEEWYGDKETGAIKMAYRYGFMVGREDGNFDPKGNMTIAEAITIAARIANIYYEDNASFVTTGKNWYDSYVEYAVDNKIIKSTDFTNYNAKITRGQMAKIFANVLPNEAMAEINDVTKLPDVTEETLYYNEIIHLYNVGVLSGNDSKGTFTPNANITRAEVSAIIARMANPDERRENNF